MLYAIIIGAIAGWLAGKIMKGSGFGLLYNIILGVIGGLVGNWMFKELGFKIDADETIVHLLSGTVGAVVIIFLAGMIRGGGKV